MTLGLRRVCTHQNGPDVFANYNYMKVKTIFKNFLIILRREREEKEREGERGRERECM